MANLTPRTSNRKAKKKTFDDFIDTEEIDAASVVSHDSNTVVMDGDFAPSLASSTSDTISTENGDSIVHAETTAISNHDQEEDIKMEISENNIPMMQTNLNGQHEVTNNFATSDLSGKNEEIKQKDKETNHIKIETNPSITENSRKSALSNLCDKLKESSTTTKIPEKDEEIPNKRRRKGRFTKVVTPQQNQTVLQTPSTASISGISVQISTKLKSKNRLPVDYHVCKKIGCGKQLLKCAIKASDGCIEATGYTSRWYHLSLEEHYCNACFDHFYRGRFQGFDEFHDWKRAWAANSKTDSSFKNITNFISEKHLTFWIKCNQCGHWRQLGNDVELTSDILRMYNCSMGNMVNTLGIESTDMSQRMPHVKFYCSQSNEDSVNVSIDPAVKWTAGLNYTPFLKFSPAAPFLTSYYPDGVGMSATDISTTPVVLPESEENVCITDRVLEIRKKQEKMALNSKPSKQTDVKKSETKEIRLLMSPGSRKSVKQSQNQVEGVGNYFQPFYKPFERGKALCMRPDVMELDEAKQFPQYVKDQGIYLAVRNLIVALWTLNQKSFLTTEKCCEYIIIRGLTRINLCENLVPAILQFATYKGLVNSGVLCNPPKPLLPPEYLKKDVIIIGAGPAGLGAARQLHNFGIPVKILEARDRIGGRAYDDLSLDGICVGHGAQIINGCVNNPMALMSHQLGLNLQVLKPQCDLYDSTGTWVPMHCDKRMDFHFNALLDIIAEWRRAQQNNSDCSLGKKIEEAHHEWMKQSGLKFTEMEEQLLNFHVGNLEFACGASLEKVSAFFWDQNETFAQFNGDHTLVQFGFSTLLESLAKGLEIKFNSPVKHIDFSNKSKISVTTSSGEELKADYVLVAVPIGVLKTDLISFTPSLPQNKCEAIERIGSGCIEKIGMLFPNRFWEDKINNANYFGYIPPDKSQKGFFTVFYDVPKVDLENGNVLMSVISGDCVDKASKMTDEEVINVAMSILRSIFLNKDVPNPVKYFVTRWKTDQYARMAYSYIHTGSSGDDYDVLAKSVDNKLFFAGEGTNRHFPQTVTGAYLSGVREAAKIAVANVNYI